MSDSTFVFQNQTYPMTEFEKILPELQSSLSYDELKKLIIDHNLYVLDQLKTQPSVSVSPIKTIISLSYTEPWVYITNLSERDFKRLDRILSYDDIEPHHLQKAINNLYTKFEKETEHTKKAEIKNKILKNEDWDGKYHFLRSLKRPNYYRFRSGLTARVLEFIYKKHRRLQHLWQGQNPLVCIKTLPSPELNLVYQGPKPREYQERALKFIEDYGKCIIQKGTGLGKTIVQALAAELFQVPCILFINSVGLGYQLYDRFVDYFGSENVGFIGDGETNWDPVEKGINIFLIQTAHSALLGLGKLKKWDISYSEDGKKIFKELANITINPERYSKIVAIIENAGLILYDEGDETTAPRTYYNVSRFFKTPHIIAFTANAWRNDNRGMHIEAVTGKHIFQMSTSEGIEQGFLSPVEVHLISIPETITKPGNTYNSIYSRCHTHNDIFHTIMVNYVKREFLSRGWIGLITVKHISHGQTITKWFKEAGVEKIKFVHASGKGKNALSANSRRLVLKQLMDHEYDIIVSTLFQRGTDIPPLNFIVRAHGDGNVKPMSPDPRSINTLQVAGRVTRLFPGKKKGVVVDFIFPYPSLREHSTVRKMTYQSEKAFQIIEVNGEKYLD